MSLSFHLYYKRRETLGMWTYNRPLEFMRNLNGKAVSDSNLRTVMYWIISSWLLLVVVRANTSGNLNQDILNSDLS